MAYPPGHTKCNGAKDKGRKCWITDYRKPQVISSEIQTPSEVAEIAEISEGLLTTEKKPQFVPNESQVISGAAEMSTASPIQTENKKYEDPKLEVVGGVEWKSSKDKGRKCWITYPPHVASKEIQITSNEVEITEALPIQTAIKEDESPKIKAFGRIECKRSKDKGRKCWITSHTETINPKETINPEDICDSPKAKATPNKEQSTSKVAEASKCLPTETKIKVFENPEPKVIQARPGRWVTMPVGYVEKPEYPVIPSENQITSKVSESPEATNAQSKEFEKCEVKQTRPGRWEIVPAGYYEKPKLSKKDLAHKYFPYSGPIKNRKLLAPRSCASSLTCWDKNGNRVRNNDGTPYMPDPEYTKFDKYWNKLPTELRLMIIEASLEEGRRVPIKMKAKRVEDSDPKNRVWCSEKWVPLIQPPSALFVNKEFREVALKKYTNFFGLTELTLEYQNAEGRLINKQLPRVEPRIPFSWSRDTLVLELQHPEWFFHEVEKFQQRDRAHVTKLAVRFDAALYRNQNYYNPPDTAIDEWDFYRGIALFPNLAQLDLLVPHDPDSAGYYQPSRGTLISWKEQSFTKGNLIRSRLQLFKTLSDISAIPYHPDPRWRWPFTVRTVQLMPDGQPSYEGVEELFLARKKLAEARVSFEDIDRWEEVVMKEVKLTYSWPDLRWSGR